MFNARVRGLARALLSNFKAKSENFKVFLSFSFIFALFTLIFASPVSAEYGQYGAYGQGGQSDALLVDKYVGTKQTTTKGGQTSVTFVDNLASNDKRFTPGQNVFFKIKVKNTSDHELSNVVVKDVLPYTLEPVNMKVYDANSRTITLAENLTLKSGEEVVFFVNSRVISQDKLPADQGLICNVNKASASNTNAYDDDNAQFCIEKQVLGVKTQPSAGPEYAFGLLALQMLGLGSGIYLKKRVN